MFKIKNFMIGSTNDDRRTSHDDEINDLTHEHTRGKRKKEANRKERANKMARVKWGRGKQEANGK